MNLTLTLHLVAGLGALIVGGGTLLREPSRARNRQFAMLCGALAIWNLGLVAHATLGGGDSLGLRLVYLLGSCAAAPLGLQFVLTLAAVPARTRRPILVFFFAAAALLWFGAATPLYHSPWGWPAAAILVLGGTLGAALVILGVHSFRLPAGPERRAHMLIFWGGIVAVVGGISDFVPRGDLPLMSLGPVAVLVFLLVLCSVIVRHRFLDVDVLLVRAVALAAGSAVIALFLVLLTRTFGGNFGVLFLASLLILSIAAPLARPVLSRARSLISPRDPVAAALAKISQALPRATNRKEIRDTIESGRRLLADDVRLDAFLRRSDQERFHLFLRSGGEDEIEETSPFAADDPLADWLARERLPLTRSYLDRERRESASERSGRAKEALDRLVALKLVLAVPLSGGERLVGWIGLGEGLSERYLTAEIAAALLAVGQQALASFERIEALEAAGRKEALAAVGELAGGLAHEVRNPVAAIRGAAQALGPAATPRQRDEMLEVIGEETERLGRFVGEFLEYARPASPRREPLSLAELARRSIRGLEAAGLEIEITLQSDEDTPPVEGDPDQLHRVFDNLIRNAAEARTEGARMRIEIHAAKPGRVVARFEDNGPGIEPDEVPQLFQPFHSTKAGGTGLGLALVHRVVEAHGGEIRVEGRPGIGAVFTLVLPAAAGPHTAG